MKPKSTLQILLASLLTDARQYKDKTQSLPLKHGLTINLKVTPDDVAHLAISRVGVAPAPLEWEIVIDKIGAPKGTACVPKPVNHRIYLVGEWQLQTELIA
jgi:hypothetical protein